MPHRSDCSIYNRPAMPIGPCDCGAFSNETCGAEHHTTDCYLGKPGPDCRLLSEDSNGKRPCETCGALRYVYEVNGERREEPCHKTSDVYLCVGECEHYIQEHNAHQRLRFATLSLIAKWRSGNMFGNSDLEAKMSKNGG